jgi:hypothetical protein
MRLFALLFSLYLTCLSCLPCADDAQVCVESTKDTVSAASHSDCGGVDLGDWCSPLCQCHCCAGAVLAPIKAVQLALLTPPQWASNTRHTPLLVAAPTWAASAVWQPPQA